MHRDTLALYEALRQKRADFSLPQFSPIGGPHHFHIRYSVIQVASALAANEVELNGIDFTFPVLGRLPVDAAIVTFDMPAELRAHVFSAWQDQSGAVCFARLSDKIGVCEGAGFWPGDGKLKVLRDGGLMDHELKCWALVMSMVLSLINTPRKVDIMPASGLDWSRQHRREVERLTGAAPFAFQTVSWELGKRVAQRGDAITTEGHRKALHWCRAHWREAREGQPNAKWVNLPWRGGWGWYTWVADCWKGHPDYGVKLQRHEPHMPDDRPERSQAAAVLNDTRWTAMTSAYRASLSEAGFAPTSLLQ